MKTLILLTGCAMLAACGETNTAPADDNAMVEETPVETAAADTSVLGTSWSFTDETGSYVETIDAQGNYITNTADGEHADHGTAMMNEDGKACFDSAMDDEGPRCWTVAPHKVGDTIKVSSDDGITLDVTRTEYTELSMPSA